MEKLISPNEVKRDVAPCVCARAQRQRGASTEGDEAKRNGGGRRERKRKKEGGGVSREWIRRDGHVENGVYKTTGGRTGRAKEETVWRTREKKARYTCLKERRDTHSTVTKHPSFGRESKERKEDGREEREGEYGERSLGRVVEMMARKGERDGGGCVRVSKIFPFLPCFLLPRRLSF